MWAKLSISCNVKGNECNVWNLIIVANCEHFIFYKSIQLYFTRFKFLQIAIKSYSNSLSFPLLLQETETILSSVREITSMKDKRQRSIILDLIGYVLWSIAWLIQHVIHQTNIACFTQYYDTLKQLLFCSYA
jgi:hypothetical protein